jgi:hypothetical protein
MVMFLQFFFPKLLFKGLQSLGAPEPPRWLKDVSVSS